MAFHDAIRRGGGNIGLPVERPNRPPVNPFQKPFVPPPQRRAGGRGFLATFMKLAKQVIPSTRRELERRLQSKLAIEGQAEEGGAGLPASIGSSGGTFGDRITNAKPYMNIPPPGDPMIVPGSWDNLTPSLIGDNIVPYKTAMSAEQNYFANRAPAFRRSKEAHELVKGRNLQIPTADIPRPSSPKTSARGFTSSALEDLLPEGVKSIDRTKRMKRGRPNKEDIEEGGLVFDTTTGKWTEG